ncbi:MAG TPA: nickel pincer cofactor biosynthesis protein LarB [Pirellulales bacterium]|nr:nickel pincer cofactor biosynthesis protein LarB [Pirellulales bacterium]
MTSAPRTAALGDAHLDLDRARRCGYPEVVYGEGKTVAVLESILRTLVEHCGDALATRVSADKAQALAVALPNVHYNPVGRTLRVGSPRSAKIVGRVAVVTAGTSDLPVAEEARATAEWMGTEVTLIADVGVAGPHRFPEQLPKIAGCDAIVVVAGMEGALPSVVGGYVDCPVIAVPTSVGYGASLGGVAALLSMLNSCAANVSVVNIDAGFKAGYLAGLIARRAQRAEPRT